MGGHEKPIKKRGGIGQFADSRRGGGAWQKRGMVFLRGGVVDTPIHNMI